LSIAEEADGARGSFKAVLREALLSNPLRDTCPLYPLRANVWHSMMGGMMAWSSHDRVVVVWLSCTPEI
jgi:hypothetical protein